MIFLAKPPGGSVQTIANAVLRLQFVIGGSGKRDTPFNTSGLQSLAHLLPEGISGYRSHESIPPMIEALDGTGDIFFISRPINFTNPDPLPQFLLRQQFGLERQECLVKFP
jgi:hypothetical protein